MAALAELAGITANELALLNSLYELQAACSSFVTYVPDDSYTNASPDSCKGLRVRPVLGRNMDWAADFLRPLTVRLRFYRGDKLLYEAVSWAGYLGILTAVKPGKYAVAVNFRQEAKETVAGMLWGASQNFLHMVSYTALVSLIYLFARGVVHVIC